MTDEYTKHLTRKPFVEYFVVFRTNFPKFWALRSPESFRRSGFLDYVFSPSPPKFTRFSSVEGIAYQAIQPKKLYDIEKISFKRSQSTNWVLVFLKSENPNSTMAVFFDAEYGGIGTRFDQMAVDHFPMNAIARVPS